MTTTAPLSRRRFVRLAAAGTGVAAGAAMVPASVVRAGSAEAEGGADLSGWDTAVGDGVWTGPGQDPVSLDDLALAHQGDRSRLVANRHERGVMAHAIAYRRRSGLPTLDGMHAAAVEFRLPDVPTTSNLDYSAQTIEFGLFIWDGDDTRLDHGLAIQWVLNPWVREFGQIRAWSMTGDGPTWQQVGWAEPDTTWHRVEIRYRPGSSTARVRLDGAPVEIAETLTPKPANWGPGIGGRLQVELVSVWPGENPRAPAHRAEFRNWLWGSNHGRSFFGAFR